MQSSRNICAVAIIALWASVLLSGFVFEAAGAEGPAPGETPVEEPSAEESQDNDVTLEELKPEPLGDLFAIKLLEKVLELEDALKYLAKEVHDLNERLTEQAEEMNQRITKLETAPPPVYAQPSGKPSRPRPPVQTRFEVGDVYLGNGFKGHDIIYETVEKGTMFKGTVEAGSTGGERVEFEIIVYDETGKMIGFKTFRMDDIELGETRPFEALIKGLSAHWIKKYEIHYLRGS